MRIPVPWLTKEFGAGDVAKAAFSALGIEQKPGCGCAKRQAKWNHAVPFQFVPRHRAVNILRQPSIWDSLPNAPAGWSEVKRCDTAVMFRDDRKDTRIIWSVDRETGQHSNSLTVCCGLNADDAWSARCR